MSDATLANEGADSRPAAGLPVGELHLRHEEDAARRADAAEQRIEGVDRQRVEEPVGVGEWRAADHGDRRAELDELPGEPLDASRGHPGASFHRRRRVLAQASGPPVDERARASGGLGRPQARLQDHGRQAESHQALGAGRGRHPLVRVRPGERHAAFHLHELGADSRPTLSHRAIREAL